MTARKWTYLAFALLFVCVALPRHVHAYIDPGTGNYLLQIILAALFGALFALKVFWTKVKTSWHSARTSLFGERKKSDQN